MRNSNLDILKFNEQYFRPSKLIAFNVRNFDYNFLDKYWNEDYNKINLPDYLFISPTNTIINYFSILREASSISQGGCGTIGNVSEPYPISYSFFTKEFRNRIDYKNYLNIFKDIGHINLIKLRNIININNADIYKYFFEIETIEPSINGNTSFAYYYGFIYIKNENGSCKISDIDLRGEDFLCAPYHGWAHNAELYVNTVYGDWCNLIREVHPTEKIGYIKNIFISGTDENEYMFQFFQLTNGTDMQINQFIKNSNGQWVPTIIDVNKCVTRFNH